jgi:hypothetical protein
MIKSAFNSVVRFVKSKTIVIKIFLDSKICWVVKSGMKLFIYCLKSDAYACMVQIVRHRDHAV